MFDGLKSFKPEYKYSYPMSPFQQKRAFFIGKCELPECGNDVNFLKYYVTAGMTKALIFAALQQEKL